MIRVEGRARRVRDKLERTRVNWLVPFSRLTRGRQGVLSRELIGTQSRAARGGDAGRRASR